MPVTLNKKVAPILFITRSRNVSHLPVKKRLVSQRNKRWYHLAQHWSKFCDNTTFAGVHLIGGTKRKVSPRNRITLFLAWLILVILACNLCRGYLVKYFNYEVKTSIRYDSVAQHQFPAITFCNANSFKRSIIGIDDDFITFMTEILTKDSQNILARLNENRKTCKLEFNETVETMALRKKIVSYHSIGDFESILKIVTTNSTMSTMKCWWNNKETNCNKHFMNHPVDTTACFEFNQDKAFLDIASGMLPVFGPEEFEKENLFVQSTSQSVGLKLLLNVNQYEYCGGQDERLGAGFSVFVHDIQSETSLDVQSSISLSPGFEYDITLQPVLYSLSKFSEWLGKCTSYEYNFLKPNSTYSQQSCYEACFLLMVSKACSCLPLQPYGFTVEVIKFIGSTKKCDPLNFNEFMCYLNINRVYTSTNSDVLCPRCKRKCLEMKYDYKISSKKMSLPRVQKLISENIPTNESVLKNFILVSFHFETMSMITVTETQSIALLNLFIYWSNILCLFLGFTIITIPELLYYIFSTIHISVKFLNGEQNSTMKKGNVGPIMKSNQLLVVRRQRLVVANENIPCVKSQATFSLQKEIKAQNPEMS